VARPHLPDGGALGWHGANVHSPWLACRWGTSDLALDAAGKPADGSQRGHRPGRASSAPLLTRHHRRGHRHEGRERCEQQAGGDARGQPASGAGARDADDADGDPLGRADPARPPVRSRSGKRGDPHDEQRSGDSRVRLLVQQVDQRRDGQDRPPVTQGAQRQAGQQPGGDRGDGARAASLALYTHEGIL
jgi:hypothetical protein